MAKGMRAIGNIVAKVLTATAVAGLLLASLTFGTASAAPDTDDAATVAKKFYVAVGLNEFTEAGRYVDRTSDLRSSVIQLRQESWRLLMVRDLSAVQFNIVAAGTGEATVVASGPQNIVLNDGRQVQAWVNAEAKLVQKSGRWYVTQASGY